MNANVGMQVYSCLAVSPIVKLLGYLPTSAYNNHTLPTPVIHATEARKSYITSSLLQPDGGCKLGR